MTRTQRLGAGTVPLLVAAALFRASQNVGQTTESLLGHERLGLGAGTIGLAIAASSVTTALVTLFVTRRVPVRLVRFAVAAGALALAGSLLGFATLHSLAGYFSSSVLLGAGGGLAMSSMASAAGGGTTGVTQRRRLAIYTLVLSASLAIGPLVESSILGANHGDPVMAYAVFSGVAAVAALVAAVDAVTSHRASPGPPVVRVRPLGLGELLQVRGWTLAVSLQLLYSMPFFAFIGFGSLLARIDYHLSAASSELPFTVLFAASLTARVALTRWPGPTRERMLIAASVPLTVAGLLLLAFGRSTGALLVGAAVLGLPHGINFPLSLALIARSVDAHHLPGANAMMLSLGNIVGIAAPALLGVLAASFGYRDMFVAVLVPVGVCAMWLAVGLRRLPHPVAATGAAGGAT